MISGFIEHRQLHPRLSVLLDLHRIAKAGKNRGRRRLLPPRLNELYAAEAGRGAALNGEPLRVSGCAALADSLLATGFACVRAGIRPDNLEQLPGIVRQIQGIRRNGSAALDLCNVAAGRFDGYWEFALNLYDVAAGALILQEAGGRVTDLAGRNRWPEAGICATNGLIHAELLKELQRQ